MDVLALPLAQILLQNVVQKEVLLPQEEPTACAGVDISYDTQTTSQFFEIGLIMFLKLYIIHIHIFTSLVISANL